MAEEVTVEAAAIEGALRTSTDAFQAIIDTGLAKSQALIDQRDALLAQLQALRPQIAALDAQIAAAEGPEVKKARLQKKLLEMANDPAQAAQLQRLGIR